MGQRQSQLCTQKTTAHQAPTDPCLTPLNTVPHTPTIIKCHRSKSTPPWLRLWFLLQQNKHINKLSLVFHSQDLIIHHLISEGCWFLCLSSALLCSPSFKSAYKEIKIATSGQLQAEVKDRVMDDVFLGQRSCKALIRFPAPVSGSGQMIASWGEEMWPRGAYLQHGVNNGRRAGV